MKHRNDFQISLRLQEADGDEFYKVDKPISAYSVSFVQRSHNLLEFVT